ncbi:hypothetical protein C0993_000579, partial [Termitomyces sp. T159_Od127]
VQPVPPVFFLEVKRQQTALIWVHQHLKPINGDAEPSLLTQEALRQDTGPDEEDEDEDEDEKDIVDTGGPISHQTFEEAMQDKIHMLKESAHGLKFQVQF